MSNLDGTIFGIKKGKNIIPFLIPSPLTVADTPDAGKIVQMAERYILMFPDDIADCGTDLFTVEFPISLPVKCQWTGSENGV